MDPRFSPMFWHDIMDLKPQEKLAAIWLAFGPSTDCLGVVKANERVFTAETWLDPSVLRETISKRPDLFLVCGTLVFCKGLVAMQHPDLFEPGFKSSSASNMLKKLRRTMGSFPPILRAIILTEYPLLEALPSVNEALQSKIEALQPLTEAPNRPDQYQSVQGGPGGLPTEEQVLEYCSMKNISDKVGSAFFRARESTGWMLGSTPLVKWGPNLTSFALRWAENEAARPSPPGSTSSHEELMAALQTEENPEKRTAIRKKLAATP